MYNLITFIMITLTTKHKSILTSFYYLINYTFKLLIKFELNFYYITITYKVFHNVYYS